MDRLAVRGRLISKDEVLAYPSKFQKSHIMIFELADEKHYEAAKTFFKEWKGTGKFRYLLLNLGFQDEKFEVRASNLFFAMRDRLAEIHGDSSRANKDALYHGLMERAGFRTMDGTPIESIKQLTKRQLWELIQLTKRVMDEEEYNYEYAPMVNDLQRDYSGMS